MIFMLDILWSCSSFRNYCIRSGRNGYSNFRDCCKKDKRINDGGKTSASEDTGSSEYKVCMITDAADITDQSFNQTTYEACRDYCKANNIDFTYKKTDGDTDYAKTAMVDVAVAEGYNIIVLPGYVFAQTVVDTSFKYPDVKFIALVMKYMPNLSPAAMVILVGTAMNMLATAAATVFVKAINMAENPNNVSSTIQYIHQKKAFSIAKIAGFGVNWFMIITIVLLIAANIVSYRTRLGLRLMACSEHPQAADSVGINVYKMLPYIISLLVLAVSSKKSRAPKAEGIHYDKGQR